MTNLSEKTAAVAAPVPASMELTFEVEQFLYKEARLLDTEEFHAWLGILTDDIHYWMPYRYQRYRKNHVEPTVKGMAYYNDDMHNLKRRVLRNDTGTCWSEDPATRSSHVISNIEVEHTDNPDEYKVYSLTTVNRNMNEDEEHLMVGHRTDILRRVGGQLKLAKRKIILDQNIFMNKSLNVFL
ncbi:MULTISPECIES: 3-phenylpropionate/cinnamic acid dioxygenase subunit beta [Cycloclasticus]|jgi:ethylbenzene dioxygenase beta subunit|uniref:3-phenylpropionate/cinnamic acid dioxygenase subunit beta n=1 Tax=Cycloclasticus TaxID=34067 RepID=UPI000910FA29|nr:MULTISPECIES: 3-phenylpropionate/cinnamic acid dioxygenase subunit beta [Cycloclasticus]PHR52165.1 MAG: ring-hydroxylating dioxygenase subunit beta [Cycloclasticus sp.]SHJ31198.1 ethylbenzene dioxygenase beta subunit [Cycloclasticus pugetii]|tara:strand:+ start:406 stop:954 length:549 start_codon:yes stop_codon:yes gene_type:complete